MRTTLFAKTAPTTAPPSGVNFRACTGINWLYFKAEGFLEVDLSTGIIPSRYVRVAYFGAETNPDSIFVETELRFNSSYILKSNGKTLNCSKCVTTDRTPPVFNCPTTTITYSQPFSPNTLAKENIIKVGSVTPGTNLQATDNCNTPLVGFDFLTGVLWGGVYPISLVAYDSAGNKAACNFNLRMPCSPSVTAPNISNCPANINVQAAAGQRCAIATWTEPSFSGNASPAALFSNFASGTCFPIGTTPVVLTAKDSCNNASTCNFNVTVTGGSVSNCRNNYGLINFDPINCQSSGGAPPTPAVGMFVEFLGANLTDGFYLSTNNSTRPTNKSNLWSKTVVAAQPALFNNCPGNWTYFKAYGFSTIGEQVFENLDKVHENVIVRIKGIGTTNPLDQIIVEVSNSEGIFNFGSYQSSAVRTKCNTCSISDQSPPVITGCPTAPVIFPLSDTKSYGAKEVSFSANIAIADNCSDNFSTFRTGNSFRNNNDGASFPLTLVAFDSAGNRATCNFTVKTSTANPTTYCAAKGTAPWEYWVGNVSLGTINNTSDKFKDFATLGYSDYTSVSTTVNKGGSYPLSISPGLSWIGNLPNAYIRAWIDFNDNKVFDNNEIIYAKNNATSLIENVFIPLTAVTGNVRMRVALKFGAYPTACETFDKGEVEDYTVNIANGTVVSDPCAGVQVITRNVVWKDFYVELEVGLAGGAADQSFVFQYFGIRQITDMSTTYTANGFVKMNEFTILKSAATGFSPPLYVGALNSAALSGFVVTPNQSNCFLPDVFLTRPAVTNQPDLTLANLTIPTPSVLQGQILNFKVDTKNIGTASATGNFNIKSYLSRDQILDASDYQDGIIPTANFAAGLTQSQVAGAMTVNATVAAGQYYLILKIDGDNQIAESNEANNVIVSAGLITVTGGTTGGGADLALSIVATPSVYRRFTTHAFRVTAQNVGSQTLTNVKVELKRPAQTSNGGSKVPSVGSFQDFCPGGIECSEWTIPTLAAGASATLDAPFFILDATGSIVVTTKLLSSTPTDTNAANNTASVTVNPAPAAAPVLALSRQKPTQYIPLIVQSISPNPTEGDVVVEVESLTAQEVQFEFSNAMGQTIQSEKRAIEKGTNQVRFDVYEFTQGIYFIQTNVGKGRNAPTKFVKF